MLPPNWWFEERSCNCYDRVPSRSISSSLRQTDRRMTYSRAVSLDIAAVKWALSYGAYFPLGAEAREITTTPRFGMDTRFGAWCYGSCTAMISPLRGKDPLNSKGTALACSMSKASTA